MTLSATQRSPLRSARVAALGLLFALGCNTSGTNRGYEGGKRPRAEVAELRVRSSTSGFELRLGAADGVEYDLAEWQRLELLPGEHLVQVVARHTDADEVPCAIDPRSDALVEGGDLERGLARLALAAGWSYSIEGTFADERCTAFVRATPPEAEAPAPQPVAAAAVAAPIPAPTDRPYVLALGTAQDGGLPQLGCDDTCCAPARADASRRRLVVSLLLVDPRTNKRWLFEATPDLREQVERAKGHPAGRELPGARPPLFEGIFLTHAHIGHYLGLAWLGREAYGTKDQVVYGSSAMDDFLTRNGPWSLMVEDGTLDLRHVAPGDVVTLGEDLTVEPLLVPHRDEFTDTFAWVIRGPDSSLLFLPDIDKWDRWERRIEDVVADVDHALLDGSFYAGGEIPGREMADIPHPFLVESIARFAPLPASERQKVHFIHLNHTNPAADPTSEAAGLVRASGMSIVAEMQRFEL